ncbi:hypothetical protein SCHPADRAFT_672524 [Schizopora paradoxa]|uniref:DUF6533 domain-containing protein n=1 Tax=Schizopora paradoxa TaxID=27342 RepID=A0A0H2R6H8_9AGAM|nr:hypothetical protein SCHPADRAFT_672524 [Schizopora paradoxa]
MDFIEDVFRMVHVLQYTTIITITLVVYEYLIKLDCEVHHLWGRRVSFGGILLALCRYLPFINIYQIIVFFSLKDTDPTDCVVGDRLVSAFVYVEFILSIAVLFTRTYAVWRGERFVLAVIVVVLLGSFAGSFYVVFSFLSSTKAAPFELSTPCLIILGNDDVWIALVFLIFCETLALGLLLVKSVQHAKATKCLVVIDTQRHSILAIMAQDGIGYFACTLAVTSANLVVLQRVTVRFHVKNEFRLLLSFNSCIR